MNSEYSRSFELWPRGAAEVVAAARFGLNWQATDYLASTSWVTVPTLVTHGTADTSVPISLSIKLKALKPSLVTLAKFPGAGHLESWNINQARYTSLLTSFLGRRPRRDS